MTASARFPSPSCLPAFAAQRSEEKRESLRTSFVPQPDPRAVTVYYKNPCRKALDLAIAGVATYTVLDDNGVVEDVRIAMSAVAVVPKRAYEAEEMLKGKKLTEELINEAANHASLHECSPISDIRRFRRLPPRACPPFRTRRPYARNQGG